MCKDIKFKINKDIKYLKHKYVILKIKWVLLFVFPILIVVLAYQAAKQFIRIKMKELCM